MKKERLGIIVIVILVISFIVTLITSIIVGNIEAKKSLDKLKTNIENISRIEIYENGYDEKKAIVMEDAPIESIISNLQKASIVKNDKSETIANISSAEYRVLFKTIDDELETYYSFESEILYLDDYNLEGSFKALDKVISPIVLSKQNQILEDFTKYLKDNKELKSGIVDYEVRKDNLYITYNDKIKESDLSDIINKIKDSIPSVNGIITNPEEEKEN